MQEEPATPFFLPVGAGQRYCIHQPGGGNTARAVLFVPPFGEELNRSRRMLALQARALAARGIASLRIDLHGCGDSSGDFADARWEQWRQDLAAAAHWLHGRGYHDISLLAVRLGCQLALDTVRLLPHAPLRMAFWQLPAGGNQYLTQWLRLRGANAMFGDGQAKEGPQALRERLRQGEIIEVGGYGLAPQMAAAIDGLQPPPPPCPVSCFDIVPPPATAPLAATVRTCAEWPGASLTALQGPAFWSTAEIATCPALVDATCDFLERK
jgi:exosortase A-associated hydrolase 2